MKARLLCVFLFVSCDGASKDLGLDTSMQVDSAQFFRGSWPSETAGPSVKTASIDGEIRVGAQARSLTGEIDSAGTAVAIALDGNVGYWVLPAGLPDVASTGSPSFRAAVSFAKSIPVGPRQLQVRAVDANGHFGPPLVRWLTFVGSAPAGHLVVTLAWQNRADLDLHVVTPNGVEIFARNPSSYVPPPPGQPEAPGTPHDGGTLDFDSNAQCLADGRKAEDVVWSELPPKGHYTVRVDTPSLCEEVAAAWTVAAVLDGVTIAAASGTSTANDTRFVHGRGGGLLTFEFDVP